MSGNGVSTRSTGASIVLNAWFDLMVMIDQATSSDVTGRPSWKVAPGASFSSSERPSSWNDQLWAR